jgi:D-alanyl-lipoteichoic acid acyltransferase DltB (MBOAT superfamily)
MLFNSYPFLFAFLPVTLAGFALLGRLGWGRGVKAWLVGASLFYYGVWDWHYLFLLVSLLVVNFLIGTRWLPVSSPPLRKAGLVTGLLINLSSLAYFKYAALLIWTADRLTGAGIPIPHIILPLGISFFIFQKIAYLVDVYRGHVYSRSFLDYCLFVTFFPQLIAGPIVHPREILPQLSRRRGFGVTSTNLSAGLTLFILGLSKKVLLADNLSPIAGRLFDSASAGHAPPGMLAAWTGVLAYTLQIYFDFSGYSDMAIGLARMFSVRLPLNFNSPYQARDIIDFWRRWHMTLSRLLRDYVYIPLGGNRRGKLRRYLNLLATMLIGGLWHGANYTFVAWGALHGLYLVINHLWAGKHTARESSRLGRFAGQSLTFLSVVVAWIFFRAETFHAAGAILASMTGLHGSAGTLAIKPGYYALIAAGLAIVFLAPNTQQILALTRPALGVLPPPPAKQPTYLWRPTLAWALAIACLAITAILFVGRASEFIYYQF